MLNKANIRSVVSGAKRQLKDFQRALAEIRRIKIRETQRAGRIVHRRMGERYERGEFANDAGNVVKIQPYGAKWAKRKAQLKLDMRNGVARKGIVRQVKSPLSYLDRPDGCDFDIKRPNMTVTGRATLGKSLRTIAGKAIVSGRGKSRKVVGYQLKRGKTNKRSFLVNSYIDHFADQKARGLGSLANEDLAFMEDSANAKIAEHLASVQSASRKYLSGKARAMLRVDLRRLAR